MRVDVAGFIVLEDDQVLVHSANEQLNHSHPKFFRAVASAVEFRSSLSSLCAPIVA